MKEIKIFSWPLKISWAPGTEPAASNGEVGSDSWCLLPHRLSGPNLNQEAGGAVVTRPARFSRWQQRAIAAPSGLLLLWVTPVPRGQPGKARIQLSGLHGGGRRGRKGQALDVDQMNNSLLHGPTPLSRPPRDQGPSFKELLPCY